jgi:hypothetical protein
MRLFAGFLICVGALSWASAGFADAPDTSSQKQSMPTKTVRASKPPPLTREEQQLLAAGYKLEVRGNENFFCHKEALVGSRFSERVCQTSEQIKTNRQTSRDAVDGTQRKGLQMGYGG